MLLTLPWSVTSPLTEPVDLVGAVVGDVSCVVRPQRQVARQQDRLVHHRVDLVVLICGGGQGEEG